MSQSFRIDADAARIALGARVPIILTSRAETVIVRSRVGGAGCSGTARNRAKAVAG